MNRQTLENQQGEVYFRHKLYLHQVSGMAQFTDELGPDGVEEVLRQRMQKTYDQVVQLAEKGTPLSPYLEIGAERCQRAMVLENDLSAHGIAADISFDMLKSCEHYQRIFQRRRMPLRICCDVYNLPIRTDAIAFSFCYQTLHHFPDPAPIIREIYRILLPGATFFFDEEPYEQLLRLRLYRTRRVHAKRGHWKKLVDRIFGVTACNETAYGIVENQDISPRCWKQALSIFSEREVELSVGTYLKSSLFYPRSRGVHAFARLLGGNISGVCRKAGAMIPQPASLFSLLICPTCAEQKAEIDLCEKSGGFCCPRCQTQYLWRDGVLFLLSAEKRRQLYPEL